MSTPRGGEHRGGAQPPEDLGSFDPSLDHLIRALTVSGHPHERAGRDAALAAFRAANEQPRSAGLGTAAGPSRRPRHLLPARLAAVAAAGFAAIVGVTAAAYAQALPASVQHIAYSVFAPLGVPNSEPNSGTVVTSSSRSASPSSTVPISIAASAGGTCPCPGQSSATASATAPDAGGYAITVTAASTQVPTGTRDLFTGQVSRRGHPASGVKIELLERTAGSPDWRLAASGVTGARGRVRLLSPRLTTSTTFRLAGPSGGRSAPVTVTVTVTGTSPVRLRLVSGKVTDRLIVAAPGASSGEVVSLMELVSGAWETVASKPLGPPLRAAFALPAASAAGHLYRADLGATGSTPMMSKLVWIPRFPSTGAKLIQPSPSSSSGATSTPQPTSSTAVTTAPEPPPATDSTQTPDPSATQDPPSTPASPSTPKSTTTPTRSQPRHLLMARWDRLPAPAPGTASCAKQPFTARDR